jgi:hypothetical protein
MGNQSTQSYALPLEQFSSAMATHSMAQAQTPETAWACFGWTNQRLRFSGGLVERSHHFWSTDLSQNRGAFAFRERPFYRAPYSAPPDAVPRFAMYRSEARMLPAIPRPTVRGSVQRPI